LNRIALSYVRSPRGLVVVSTIRLTERWATAMPKYETLVFAARRVPGSGTRKIVFKRPLDGSRYDLYAEARNGHAALVAKWQGRKPNRSHRVTSLTHWSKP
jgi:hypothetical protein